VRAVHGYPTLNPTLSSVDKDCNEQEDRSHVMSTTPETSARRTTLGARLLTPRNVGIVALVAVLIAAGFSTKVVKLEDATSTQVFNAIEYAEANYDSEIVPAIEESATELSVVLDAIATDEEKAKEDYGHSSNPFNPYSYAVTVTGVAGEATDVLVPLTVDGLDPSVLVDLLLVPGTSSAIRDVTGQVDLNQFLNQVEYLHASLELNNKVTDTVINPFLAENPAEALAGKTLRITGAYTDDANGAVEIVPISIEVVS
jgi:predicted lipoprotein